MKWFIPFLLALCVLAVPAAYLYTDVLVGSNSVTITAVVPGPTLPPSEPEPTSVSSTSGGGGFFSNFFGGGQGTVSGNSDNAVDSNGGSNGTGTSGGGTTGTSGSHTGEATNGTGGTSTETSGTPATEPIQSTSIRFGGYAFPDAVITFTLDGKTSSTVQADSEGYFEGSYPAVSEGDHAFTFQAQDFSDDSSRLVSYVYTVQPESPVYISSVLLPPVFVGSPDGSLDGVTIPGSTVEIFGMNSSTQEFGSVGFSTVKSDGTFSYDVDLKNLSDYDSYYVQCTYKGKSCGYSGIIQLQTVGSSFRAVTGIPADFTHDVHVNYVDFSFMRAAYLNHSNVILYDLNSDGVVDLKDFSILNYQWTQ